MPSVLGIVGSARRNGNSEMMVRVALEGAVASGAQTEILRLTDFDIKPCRGCLSCVLKDQDCPQGDDAEFVLGKLLTADAVVLGVPVYVLSPAGSVKMLLDRVLMAEHIAPGRSRSPRPAAAIVTLGRSDDWIGFSVPLLSSTLLCAGFWIADTLVAPAPGPGEILLERDVVERSRAIGRDLLSTERRFPSEDTRCPICFGEAFSLRGDGQVECPICLVQGEVIGRRGEKALIRFDADYPTRHRFVPHLMEDHMHNWVRASQPRFLARLDTIRQARAPFKDKPVDWVKPPAR